MRDGLSLIELAAQVEALSGGKLTARYTRPEVRITGVAPLAAAGKDDLAFLASPRYRTEAAASAAGALVVTAADAAWLQAAGGASPALVIVDRPYAWYAHAAQLLYPPAAIEPEIAATAVVADSATIDPTARIDALAVIGRDATIGAGAWIGASAVVADGASIGPAARLHPRAVVLERCRVGARSIVHSGAVIGADGFGFAPLEGRWIKIPQVGAVVIGDDVEVGANTTIDRGTLSDTVIEDGVKLDNQVQVAHNCVIGAHTAIAGCVGIAGSARIGRRCQIGGAAMIAGHLSIADDCIIGGGTLVASSIDQAGHYTGSFPMMKNGQWQRAAAVIRQLDDLRDRVRQLEAAQRRSDT